MLKHLLTAASITLLLAGPASGATDPRRDKATPEREPAQETRKKASTPTVLPNRAEPGRPDRGANRDENRDGGHDRDRGDDRGRGRERDDGDHDGRDRDRRDDARRVHDWRDNDHGRRDDDWRDNDHRGGDWRHDDDWRRRGWTYQGGRNDGWRYYRGHDNRHWRYVPPTRYTFDFGYRSGYELAWRDWLSYGRYDRYWRRPGYGYGASYGHGAGYEAGWRDAAYYYGRGYRPDYWAYDPQGGWFFSFRIEG